MFGPVRSESVWNTNILSSGTAVHRFGESRSLLYSAMESLGCPVISARETSQAGSDSLRYRRDCDEPSTCRFHRGPRKYMTLRTTLGRKYIGRVSTISAQRVLVGR